MEEAIIGVLGAGILGMLGIFLQAIRSDLRSLGERMDARFAGTEEILGDIRERLARVEAIQEEHGRLFAGHGRLLADHGRLLADHDRLLAQMMGHGERIAAIEGTEAAG